MKNHLVFFCILFLVSIRSAGQSPVNSTLILEEKNVKNAYPRLSKDNKRILYQTNRSGKWQLEIMDMASHRSVPVMRDTFNNNFPEWSADNKWIAFVSDRDGNPEVYIMKSDGSDLKRLTNDKSRDIHPYFSPDNRYLLFNSDRGGSLDIYRITLSDNKLDRLTNTPEHETCARYSPDMKHMIFLRNDEKTDDIFRYDFDTKATTNVTNTPASTDGWPMYSASGKWIWFSSMENGSYCIYKIMPDGSNKQLITSPTAGEEDARVYISYDEKMIIYNKEAGSTISIYSAIL